MDNVNIYSDPGTSFDGIVEGKIDCNAIAYLQISVILFVFCLFVCLFVSGFCILFVCLFFIDFSFVTFGLLTSKADIYKHFLPSNCSCFENADVWKSVI